MDLRDNYYVKMQLDYTTSPHTRPGWKRRYDFVTQNLRSEFQAFDAGCGLGEGTSMIAGRCACAVGADIDPFYIEYCKTAWQRIQFQQIDVTRTLPFPDNHFDIVSAIEMLEHLPTIHGLNSALVNFRRVLKPGGILIASVPNLSRAEPKSFSRQVKLLILIVAGSHLKKQARWHEHYRLWTGETFQALLEKHFSSVSVYGERFEGITQDVETAPYLMARGKK